MMEPIRIKQKRIKSGDLARDGSTAFDFLDFFPLGWGIGELKCSSGFLEVAFFNVCEAGGGGGIAATVASLVFRSGMTWEGVNCEFRFDDSACNSSNFRTLVSSIF